MPEGAPGGPRLSGRTRREVLRGAATGAVAAGLGLAGCSGGATAGQSSASAAPAISPNTVTVPFQLWTPSVPTNKTTTALIQQFTDQTLNAGLKGYRAVWVGGGNMAGVVTSVLAGANNVPWVVASCCGDWPIIQPFLAKLDPFFKTDNIDTSATWHAGQLDRFQESDGTYGLPEDAASDAYLYRQDILDQLGLSYPDPSWTWTEAANLWQSCSGQTTHGWRYGVACPFGAGTTEGLPTVVAGFGGQFQSADRTQCLLNQPAAIQAGEYWLNMVWSKVATDGDGTPNPAIWTGNCVFSTGAEPTIIQAVQKLGNSVKWDFVPWPSFPARSVGKLHDNFYGMLNAAPNTEIAWQILKWAAIDPDWQRFYMQLALAPPAVASLLEEWYTVMQTVAPVLKNKQLHYWGDATLNGLGVYDYEFFKYSPAQANALVSQWWSQMWNNKVSVTAGFTQLAQQINALEAQGASSAGALVQAAKNFPTTGADIAGMPTGI
jgi:ABC-type glycerol-3-phosphate transport system substrate-binding protein